MSLCYREQRQLRRIEADLLQSDSHLTAMLYVSDRLYSGQDMPGEGNAADSASSPFRR
jgi:hypothetical protein